jgi:Rrf2 family protein
MAVMKLSVRGEYALRALIVLGLDYIEDDSVVRIQEVSKRQNIPKRFLEQILNDLKSAGIVESKRGVAGGYRLKLPPDRITLAEVIRHIEGPLAPVSCVSAGFYEKCSCPDESKCGIRSVMKEVRDAIVKILEEVTVAQLCERVRKLQGEHSNPLDYVI